MFAESFSSNCLLFSPWWFGSCCWVQNQRRSAPEHLHFPRPAHFPPIHSCWCPHQKGLAELWEPEPCFLTSNSHRKREWNASFHFWVSSLPEWSRKKDWHNSTFPEHIPSAHSTFKNNQEEGRATDQTENVLLLCVHLANFPPPPTLNGFSS